MKQLILSGILLCFSECFASGGSNDTIQHMPLLVIQLGLIILLAKFGSYLAEKCKIPGVLGELIVGVIISPYLLGSFSLPAFPGGLFASGNPNFPVLPELYGIAIIASVLLLFLSGLETDISLFFKYSVSAIVIGIGGIFFSFIIGAYTGSLFLNVSMLDTRCLFLGIMSTATSVGITARILSENRKMETPEGVTIIAAAVIDDVLGVVLFAVVLGISLAMKTDNGGSLNWLNIAYLAFKEIAIWLSVTLLGLYFSTKISNFLKRFNKIVYSILALGIALILGGLFEKAGLAMIIGAYVAGFSLSKTELSVSIQEVLLPVKNFLVPVFFTVMGMLVNVKALFSFDTMIFGLIFTLGAILSKLVGCGLCAGLTGFNYYGSKRIGLGMIPRGEVALIVAGTGLSYGLLSDDRFDLFSIGIMMTLITTLITPPFLSKSLKDNKKGVRKDSTEIEKKNWTIHLNDTDLLDLLRHKLLMVFKSYGFFISRVEPEELAYQLRKDSLIITLIEERETLNVIYEENSELLIRRIIQETLNNLDDSFKKVKRLTSAISENNGVLMKEKITDYLNEENIILLEHEEKENVIWEMLTHLAKINNLADYKDIYYNLIEIERKHSSGLNYGLAAPHYRMNDIEKPLLVLGISKSGVEFNAIDKKLSHVILLMLSPKKGVETHISLISDFILCFSFKDVERNKIIDYVYSQLNE
jgi:Kef-type K+ transport system membrane component KefB/mannitol/fructose-specific phosphotransferase system IIA component (Ntr-type)